VSDSVETFQLSTEAAEIYEHKFVPALFGEWADHLVAAADITAGRAVLDVACGTGVVARAVADRLAGSGRVVGVDINEGMLAVARRIRPNIEWHHGDAADLPFPDASFDAALCQASLMYFPDRAKALREMARVVRSGGTVAVQVWTSLESQPGYRPFADIAARHAGREALDLIGSYFSLGDLDLTLGLFEQAGLRVSGTRTRLGAVRFGSIDEFVTAEIDSTPLAERIDEDVYSQILQESRRALGSFVANRGRVEIPLEGHLIIARTR
jgi:SAM-dependent methyltransferase